MIRLKPVDSLSQNEKQRVDPSRRRFLWRTVTGTLGLVAADSVGSALLAQGPPSDPSGEGERFTTDLAIAIASLRVDEFLILISSRTQYFVQFWREPTSLRMEAVSNRFLSHYEAGPISGTAQGALLAAGWNAPSDDQDGSPNYYRDFRSPIAYRDVAALAIRTLREIYGAFSPAALEYKAESVHGMTIKLPTLGIPRVR